MNPKLTHSGAELAAQPGQAALPCMNGRQCFSCKFWGAFNARSPKRDVTHRSRCAKAAVMARSMGRPESTPLVIGSAAACRYYEEADGHERMSRLTNTGVQPPLFDLIGGDR